MSEYWVSKKKYWCQYCETFIADDAPSRSQHENGLRHKGNKERYIRNLYKTGIKKKQDLEEEKREMKFVEAAAQAAFAKDVSAGLTSASKSISSDASTSKPKPKPKSMDPYADYTTAASLGIEDPDADFEAAEKLRKSEGTAGDWVAVVPPPPPLPSEIEDSQPGETETEFKPTVRKREEEPVDEEDTRRFKLRKKTVAVGLGEIYDPGVITIKPRKENEKEELSGSANNPAASTHITATEKPVWVSRGWKKAGEPTFPGESLPQDTISSEEESKMKLELEPADTLAGLSESVKESVISSEVVEEVKKEEERDVSLSESQPSGAGSFFRKRKVPVNSTAGKRKER